ncbi:MAG: glycoside hydrolase family 15 protein [Actinomycetes bacterium]
MAGRIEDYALVGDMQTAALIGRDGSVDWLCFPRFDSPAAFAALLGGEDNGHWRVAPRAGGLATRRRYRGDTLILESEWDTPQGSVRVIDLMPPRGEAPDLVRIVEGLSGRVEMQSVLRLRFDYGHVVPWVRRVDDGQIAAIAGPDSIYLRADVPTYGQDFATHADFSVSEGDQVGFVLTWHPSHLKPPKPVSWQRELGSTETMWTRWGERCRYRGGYRDPVMRSLVTLKALTYSPTGGIVAAPTTSLPEAVGGERNWDYRFCWLRDATMALNAFVRSGHVEEAKAWREWLLRAVAGDPHDLQIMYGVAGERRLPEYEVPWLAGYEGSSPVRVGNAAVSQTQLDVYGEVVEAMQFARAAGLAPDEQAWSLQRVLLEYLEGHWQQPDEGIWEVRGPQRHFTHSKVMAWVAADRAVAAIEHGGQRGDADRWRAMRAAIHKEVTARAYDPVRNTFTQSYGSRELDAALLLIPQVGFLPPEDPRVHGTVAAVQRELSSDGLVRRYDTTEGSVVDGLGGEEGAFLACTFWLADSLHLTGYEDEARTTFERVLDLRNDVGLLAEEYDPVSRRMLGNFPQAFSHVPLVNTACTLTEGAVAAASRAGAGDASRRALGGSQA